MATQLTFWNVKPMEVRQGWNDVRLPDEFYAFYKKCGHCPNCRMKLRHPMHALNHYRKFHMLPRFRFFVWKTGVWNEVTSPVYLKARRKGIPTARTK
jgi:hypothetical protein